MTRNDEKGLRELCRQALCRQAMTENDPHKLLDIYLALNWAMEQEQQVFTSGGSAASQASHP
jgi:hypothetical protein